MIQQDPLPPVAAKRPQFNTNETDDPETRINRCITAIAQLDASRLESELSRAAVALSQPQLLEQIIEPLMCRIGELWREGNLRIADEHMASAVVRTFIGSMKAAYQPNINAPRLVIATPAGQVHELGALMAATMATAEGWHVTYLGADLPAEELAGAVRQSGADVLGLSIVYPGDDPALPSELARLGQLLGRDTTVLIGGRSAANYSQAIDQIGAHLLDGVAAYRQALENLRLPRAPSQ